MAAPESLEEVATELARVYGSLERLSTEVNGKLDRICDRMDRSDEDIAENRKQVAVLEQRVSALEKRVYTASGAAALIGMAVPYVVQSWGGV